MMGELRTSITVKKKGLGSIQGYEYELYDYRKQIAYNLHDVKWLIYIYFHMKGTLNNYKFEAYADWDEKVVLKINKKKYATMDFNAVTFKVTINIVDEVESYFMEPEFLT